MNNAIELYPLNKSVDLYPSRNGLEPVFNPRHDPVVYHPDMYAAPISYEYIEQYQEQGFLVLDSVFSEQEITCFQKQARCMLEEPELYSREEVISEPGSGEVRSIFMIHAISPLFAKLVSDRRLVALAEYILDDQVYVHQSRLNYKPGFHGKEFYWHSDFETWHVEDGMPNMRALSLSINLTENHEVNGPLMLIPGSHKDYVVCSGETPDNHFQQSLKKQEYGIPDEAALTDLASRYGINSVVGKPGSVTVFDCNIMHGSNSNITPFPRSNLFLVYNALANGLRNPYCGKPPRPEYIASRKTVTPILAQDNSLKDYAFKG